MFTSYSINQLCQVLYYFIIIQGPTRCSTTAEDNVNPVIHERNVNIWNTCAFVQQMRFKLFFQKSQRRRGTTPATLTLPVSTSFLFLFPKPSLSHLAKQTRRNKYTCKMNMDIFSSPWQWKTSNPSFRHTLNREVSQD